MFDKMQYVIEAPTSAEFNVWKCQIDDIDGKPIGLIIKKVPLNIFSAKPPQFWFEDLNGSRLGETRNDNKHRLSGYAIYDQKNEACGKIRYPMAVSDKRKIHYDLGSWTLFDSKEEQIAKSDEFSWDKTDSFSLSGYPDRFRSLIDRGLKIRAPDGNIIAEGHAGFSPQSCQIDIYPSNVGQLLILSMFASLILQS